MQHGHCKADEVNLLANMCSHTQHIWSRINYYLLDRDKGQWLSRLCRLISTVTTRKCLSLGVVLPQRTPESFWCYDDARKRKHELLSFVLTHAFLSASYFWQDQWLTHHCVADQEPDVNATELTGFRICRKGNCQDTFVHLNSSFSQL